MTTAPSQTDLRLLRAIKAANRLADELGGFKAARTKTSALSLTDLPLPEDPDATARLQQLADAMTTVLENIQAAPDLTVEQRKALLIQACNDFQEQLQAFLTLETSGKSLTDPAAAYVADLRRPANVLSLKAKAVERDAAKQDKHIAPYLGDLTQLGKLGQ